MRIVYFVDTLDNYKDVLCVFKAEDYLDNEKLADAIINEIREAGFLDQYENQEEIWEIGRGLAYVGFYAFQEYEFYVEDVKQLHPNESQP